MHMHRLCSCCDFSRFLQISKPTVILGRLQRRQSRLFWFSPGRAERPVLRALHLVPSVHKCCITPRYRGMLAHSGERPTPVASQRKPGSRPFRSPWGAGAVALAEKEDRSRASLLFLSTARHCFFLCCRLVRNVSWPLCPIAEGVISPA